MLIWSAYPLFAMHRNLEIVYHPSGSYTARLQGLYLRFRLPNSPQMSEELTTDGVPLNHLEYALKILDGEIYRDPIEMRLYGLPEKEQSVLINLVKNLAREIRNNHQDNGQH